MVWCVGLTFRGSEFESWPEQKERMFFLFGIFLVLKGMTVVFFFFFFFF